MYLSLLEEWKNGILQGPGSECRKKRQVLCKNFETVERMSGNAGRGLVRAPGLQMVTLRHVEGKSLAASPRSAVGEPGLT